MAFNPEDTPGPFDKALEAALRVSKNCGVYNDYWDIFGERSSDPNAAVQDDLIDDHMDELCFEGNTLDAVDSDDEPEGNEAEEGEDLFTLDCREDFGLPSKPTKAAKTAKENPVNKKKTFTSKKETFTSKKTHASKQSKKVAKTKKQILKKSAIIETR